MEMSRTIKLKLSLKPEEILPTISAYTKAYNYVVSIGWQDQDFNGVSLHHKTYNFTRENFNLPSQLAISSRMRATESLKSVFTRLEQEEKASCPVSKQLAVRLDARSFNVWFDRNEVSILTLNERIKTCIQVPKYFQKYLSWKRASADLFVKNNAVYLNIVMTKVMEDKSVNTENVIGIDRGINNLAVCSNNKFFSGKKVKQISKRYKTLRSKLQSVGTKSAKRHLKRLSGKENRFKTDVNHCIAKQIVESVPENSVLVLEKLTGIRKRKLKKEQRSWLNKWTFYQLEEFLIYKAQDKNCKVKFVSGAYTSQACSKCGYTVRANRKRHSFKCKHCGFELNADLNASRNIRNKFSDSYKLSERAESQPAYRSGFVSYKS